MVAAYGASRASAQSPQLHALQSDTMDTERPGNLAKYSRRSAATLRTWQAKCNAKLSVDKVLYVITLKPLDSYVDFLARLGRDGPPAADTPETKATYEAMQLQWHDDTVKLYDILVMWPGVGEDPEIASLIEPGGTLDLARDGLALYRALVQPASFADAASQRQVKLETAQVYATAYNPDLPSPFPRNVTYEFLEQWVGQFIALHRLDASWHPDETSLVQTLVMLLRRIPSARAIVQVLEHSWHTSDTYPSDLRVASKRILTALGPELPREHPLLPMSFGNERRSTETTQLHQLGADDEDSEYDDPEFHAMRGPGAPAPARRSFSSTPRGDRPPMRPSTSTSTFSKRNACGSCPAIACGNLTSSKNRKLCSAYNPNIDPKEGATRSQLMFLKDTARIVLLLPPTVDISNVSPRRALKEHQPALRLAADGVDESNQDAYQCFVLCDDTDESPAAPATFGTMHGDVVDPDSLAQSLAMLTSVCGECACSSDDQPSATLSMMQGSNDGKASSSDLSGRFHQAEDSNLIRCERIDADICTHLVELGTENRILLDVRSVVHHIAQRTQGRLTLCSRKLPALIRC